MVHFYIPSYYGGTITALWLSLNGSAAKAYPHCGYAFLILPFDIQPQMAKKQRKRLPTKITDYQHSINFRKFRVFRAEIRALPNTRNINGLL
ncbi:MAG: hypothetical protein ACOYJK_08690 [Prevotella sp.]